MADLTEEDTRQAVEAWKRVHPVAWWLLWSGILVALGLVALVAGLLVARAAWWIVQVIW